MAKTKLNANQTIDTLTQDELYETLTKQTVSYFQELSRGFTTARFDTQGAVSGGAITLPPTSQRPLGPQDGFAWTVRRLSIYGLGTGDIINVFRNSADPSNFIGIITNTAPLLKFDRNFILRGGEAIIFTGTSLAGTTLTVSGEAVETSELDLYKMLG